MNAPAFLSRVLDPRQTWDDGSAYDRQAQQLSEMFEENAKQLGIPAAPAASEITLVPTG